MLATEKARNSNTPRGSVGQVGFGCNPSQACAAPGGEQISSRVAANTVHSKTGGATFSDRKQGGSSISKDKMPFPMIGTATSEMFDGPSDASTF